MNSPSLAFCPVFCRSIIVVALLSSLSLGLRGGEVWTLDKALATAFSRNPDSLLAKQRVEASAALLQQAKAAWYPQVSVQGSYGGSNNSMAAFGSILNQRTFSFAQDFNHPGTVDNFNATGLVRLNLYNGGQSTARREAAKAGGRAAEQELRSVRNALEAQVVEAYLAVRKAREARAAVSEGVKAYEATLAAAKARYGAGQVLKADLLTLEVQLAQTREQSVAARHAVALAEQAFRFVLGLEASAETLELAEDETALARLTVPVSFAFSGRPELLAAQEQVRAAEALVRAAKGGRLPSVNAFAGYQYDQGWQMDSHADSWSAGLSVDLNVFDGGLVSGKVREARAALASAREALRKVSLAAGLEVEQARLSFEDAKERLSVTETTVAQAEESASLSRARFAKGALLAAELIGAESRLLEAKVRRSAALADERAALCQLRKSLGLPVVEGLSEN